MLKLSDSDKTPCYVEAKEIAAIGHSCGFTEIVLKSGHTVYVEETVEQVVRAKRVDLSKLGIAPAVDG